MTGSLILQLEDRRIAGHLNAVGRLLRRRSIRGITRPLHKRRTELLDRLAGYAQRGVFPRNDSSVLLSPVFVDPDGRECAVAHLIGKDGDLVSEVSASHNLARIRELPDDSALGRWQRGSGFGLDELALIQPQYTSAASVALGALPGVIVLLAAIISAWVSHAVRRTRFRLVDANPNVAVLISAAVAALAGWWLIGEALWAWELPDIEGNYFGALRDAGYSMVVWLTVAVGVVGVGFGLATVLRRISTSMTWAKTSVVTSNLAGFLQHRISAFITACLAMIGPLVWAFAVTAVTQGLWPRGVCASGRGLRSQWLPFPHRQCFLDGQVVATSYADTLFVAIALAPVVWVILRTLIRTQQQVNLKTTNYQPKR